MTMSTKSKIAAIATLATLIAAPAFAGDQNTATELEDSGRYVPQAQVLVNVPSGAYASARHEGRGVQILPSTTEAQDFQLGGR
jgi:hypothetical protein